MIELLFSYFIISLGLILEIDTFNIHRSLYIYFYILQHKKITSVIDNAIKYLLNI